MISVDDDVVRMIEAADVDYRICTACYGPALVPVTVKAPKNSDIVINVGNHKLYISRIQAQYIDRVTSDMVYNSDEIDSCPAFYYSRH
jgi:hypothetical protein